MSGIRVKASVFGICLKLLAADASSKDVAPSTFEEVLRICGVKGSVDGPIILSPSVAQYRIAWS